MYPIFLISQQGGKTLMIVSFCSIKGGVAKSTSCANLAAALARNKPKKYKVLIFDFDSQAGLTHHLSHPFPKGFKASLGDALSGKYKIGSVIHSYEKNLDFIPISFSFYEAYERDFTEELKTLIEGVKDDYDFIFFDLYPSVFPNSIIPLSLSDFCIIPVFCKGGLSVLGLKAQVKVLAELKKKNKHIEIGVLATFVDRTKLSKDTIAFLKKECDSEFFEAAIRENTSLGQAAALGKHIFGHSPKSYGAQDYRQLAKEFLKRVKTKGGK